MRTCFYSIPRFGPEIKWGSGDECAYLLAHDYPLEIVGAEEIKNDDRHFVVHAKRERGRIHHLELLLKRFEVRDFGVTFGFRVLFWVAVVDAIDLRRFENDLR